jgi:hypothetical protein
MRKICPVWHGKHVSELGNPRAHLICGHLGDVEEKVLKIES